MMTVQVTTNEISHGKKLDCYNCPTSLAITRTLDLPGLTKNGGVWCSVDLFYLNIFYSDESSAECLFSAATTQEMKSFIVAFDKGLETNPYSFNLDITEKELRRIREAVAKFKLNSEQPQ